jgi:hypothetical protein
MTRAKVDNNHGEIVAGLRQCGYWVLSTATIKAGFPDLVVILPGVCVLLEVKQRGEPLTPMERDFHDRARATGAAVFVVHDVEEALHFIGQVINS